MFSTDLSARTFQFACQIVRLCRQLSVNPGVYRQIGAQLVRAGTSVGANFEEARAAHSRREFACKLSLVLREAREAHYWLRLIQETGLMPASDVSVPMREANELVAIFTAAVRRAKQSADVPKRRA